MESHAITELLARYSYLAVLGLLSAAGVGAPVSEDLVLIAGGAVIAHSGGSLPLMIAAGWVGTVVGDSLLFRIGRHLGPKAARQKHLSKLLTPARVERVHEYYRRFGMATVATIRFIPGLRATTILISGSSGLPFGKFVLADGLAAMVTAPLLVWLGFRFGSAVLRDVSQAGRVALVVVVAALIAALTIRLVRQRRARTSAPG